MYSAYIWDSRGYRVVQCIDIECDSFTNGVFKWIVNQAMKHAKYAGICRIQVNVYKEFGDISLRKRIVYIGCDVYLEGHKKRALITINDNVIREIEWRLSNA